MALMPWISIGICACIWLYLCAAFWGETYDDVFLAYQYAKNIEAGHGFVFNIGEHFLGTPAPLFVALLVTIHRIVPQFSLPEVGTLISSAGLSLTAYALFAIGLRGGYSALCSGVIALAAIFNPFTLLVLGGESPIYLALITFALFAVDTKRVGVAGVLLGLALMSRTEALIPIALICTWIFYSTKKIPARLLTAILFTTLPWIVFAFLEFGSPLTNSFIAKVSQVSSGRKPFPFGFARWFQTVIFGENPLLVASLIPSLLGLIALCMNRSAYRLVVLWGLAQTLAYCCMPIPFYHWYAAHVGVLGGVLLGLGLCKGSELVAQPQENFACATLFPGTLRKVFKVPHGIRLAIARGAVACGALTVIVLTIITYRYDQLWPHSQANELYSKTGLWFAENSARDARIAYLEIGQIAFYSERYIIDTLGLVTPGVAAKVATRDWLWAIKEYKPDYIILNQLFSRWPDMSQLFLEPWFTEGFHKATQLSTERYPVPLVIYKRLPTTQIPNP
jgi:hypothetical protein